MPAYLAPQNLGLSPGQWLTVYSCSGFAFLCAFLKHPWVPNREGGSICSLVLASWGDWLPLPSGVQEAELFSVMWLLYPPMENARAQLSQAEQLSPKDVHILTPELLNMSPYMC